MTLDIAKFHRRTPIAPAHKRWFVMQGRPGQYYIQHCCPFGARASEGNSGEIAGAMVDIWRYRKIGPVCKWADDMTIFRAPDDKKKPIRYQYDRAEVLGRIASLGIPWHPEKGQDFSSTFTYIGWMWNITEKSVALPEEKRKNILALIEGFVRPKESSQDLVSQVHGVLASVVYVYPLGGSYLPSLATFKHSFSKPWNKLPIPEAVLDDVSWWIKQLKRAAHTQPLLPPGPPIDRRVSVDASADSGIVIVCDQTWVAWTIATAHQSCLKDAALLNGYAIELTIHLLINMGVCEGTLEIECNNRAFIAAFNKGRNGDSAALNLSIRASAARLARHKLALAFKTPEEPGENPATLILRGDIPAGYIPLNDPTICRWPEAFASCLVPV